MINRLFWWRREAKALSQPSSRGGWWPIIREPFTGAWQRNVEVSYNSVLSHHADFACRTLIASDIAKLRIKLVQRDDKGVWSEVTNSAYSPVLRKPNHFQTRIQFIEAWVLSKLQRGNTYVLKGRDNRNVVTSLYVLDPNLVKPLIADSGDVYYELRTDKLSRVFEESVIVPASEIIHDRFNCFFHPLVGLSPIFAGGLAATQGIAIQEDSTTFFRNGAQPGGILTAPEHIPQEVADRIREYWNDNFAGKNAGKVAVLGDGLNYTSIKMKAVDSQVIEQLKWTAEVICSAYHVPPYKIGVGDLPSYDNIQALNVEYYSQCLQALIESIELCMDEGLGIGEEKGIGVEFDLDGLLRMDSVSQMQFLDRAKGKMTVNEMRRRLDLPPVDGGDTVYLQEQDHSLEWLARRDAQDPANDNAEAEAEKALQTIRKRFLGYV